MNFLKLINCSFGYKDKENLLNEISFELNKGDILAVMGCNGVGKTTLLKCICGIYDWHKGLCLLGGKPSNTMRKNIGYVPQISKVTFTYNVRDFICFGRSRVNPYFASPSEKDYRETDRVIQEFNIEHIKDKRCDQLSGGELQLAYMAKAFVADPQLLIMDEPESNLDFRNQLNLLDQLKKLVQEKEITIILNSHYLNNVIRVANKCLLLAKNDYLFGSIDQEITENSIERFFGVKSERIHYNHAGKENVSFHFTESLPII